MGDEIRMTSFEGREQILHPNGGVSTSKTIALLGRRHIVAGEFHYIGREASTRWASGPDLSIMSEAGALDPVHETLHWIRNILMKS